MRGAFHYGRRLKLRKNVHSARLVIQGDPCVVSSHEQTLSGIFHGTLPLWRMSGLQSEVPLAR